MICPRCNHDNPPGANFCSSCGSPLAEGDETTVQLQAIEEGLGIEEEWGNLLGELPAGAGLLVVRRGPNEGSRYLLDADETSAGRHPDSDIFLDDITVSRRHALLRRTATGHEIRDVGSLNGTYVNHERVEHAPIRHGDEIQIGRFVLVFLVGGAR